MKHLDTLQRNFLGQVQVLLVGYTGSLYMRTPDDAGIREVFEKYRKKFDLGLPIAYDSTLFKIFDIGQCPVVIVVDPKGIIRGITYRFTQDDFLRFLAGESPELPARISLSEERSKSKNKSK